MCRTAAKRFEMLFEVRLAAGRATSTTAGRRGYHENQSRWLTLILTRAGRSSTSSLINVGALRFRMCDWRGKLVSYRALSVYRLTIQGAYGVKRGTRARRLSMSQSRSEGEPSRSADDRSKRMSGRLEGRGPDKAEEKELEEEVEEERECWTRCPTLTGSTSR